MLVLTREDVESLLDLDQLVGALARAHEELSSGAVSMPPRIAALAADGLLGAMPAYSPSAGLGCKLVTLFPHNAYRPTHQAAIVLFEPDIGTPCALMDGTYITATRTAAAAALATQLLARVGARPGTRARGDHRRRVARLVVCASAGRRAGARGRRPRLGRRARRARLGQEARPGDPR